MCVSTALKLLFDDVPNVLWFTYSRLLSLSFSLRLAKVAQWHYIAYLCMGIFHIWPFILWHKYTWCYTHTLHPLPTEPINWWPKILDVALAPKENVMHKLLGYMCVCRVQMRRTLSFCRWEYVFRACWLIYERMAFALLPSHVILSLTHKPENPTEHWFIHSFIFRFRVVGVSFFIWSHFICMFAHLSDTSLTSQQHFDGSIKFP